MPRIAIAALTSGVLLFTAVPAVAADSQEGSGPEPGQVEATDDAMLGEADLADGSPLLRSGKYLPYNCRAQVDYPHRSYTTRSTINAHFDTNCGSKAPNLSTEAKLSRSCWYGWEHLTTRKGSKSNTYKMRVVTPKACKPGTWYKYKGQARFYVSGPRGKGSAFVYNQNDKEIRCNS